jgi:glutamate-1-semialdehyde 2,1-aminomutase
MSLGSVLLGHAYQPVLDAVRKQLILGVNFCRPSYIESELAELLVDIIPSAEMVKFGKNGSDAVTASIRLARAYTNRAYVARCKSDAFNAVHDWFIGTTIMDRGVPREVSKFTLQFEYNNIESCKKLFEEHNSKIACFILEPLSFDTPENNFLEELKILCEKNGALLIFDEVVSGLRFSLGGAQEMVGVTPHLSAFGKGMANGFSVSALVGQREFMKLGGIDGDEERVFLMSSTHGGETHSIAAAIACISEIRDQNHVKHFWDIGKYFADGLREIVSEVGAQRYLEVIGYSVKPALIFRNEVGEISPVVRTFFLQEMADQNILMPYVVPSFAHKVEDMKKVLIAAKNALIKIKAAGSEEKIKTMIVGSVIRPVFRKYN